ncbi:MAG: hypothetical protein H7X95_06115 [Deltaproteobacteria bacterium]|nr:hypothetical protein [Deltaproteobacteria bacterium]
MTLLALFAVGGLNLNCGHFPAVGRGGPIYAISVDSVNGRKTANEGPSSYPACALQVGDRVARVWLADESRGDVASPAILEGDEAALKEGILIERTWSQAVVHKVTDGELAAGAAVVYVPGMPRPTIVELRFSRVRPGSISTHGRPRAVWPKSPHALLVRPQH